MTSPCPRWLRALPWPRERPSANSDNGRARSPGSSRGLNVFELGRFLSDGCCIDRCGKPWSTVSAGTVFTGSAPVEDGSAPKPRRHFLLMKRRGFSDGLWTDPANHCRSWPARLPQQAARRRARGGDRSAHPHVPAARRAPGRRISATRWSGASGALDPEGARTGGFVALEAVRARCQE